jgi:hypothetical protein
VHVNRDFTLTPQSDIVKISSPTVSLHCVDSTDMYKSEKSLLSHYLRTGLRSTVGAAMPTHPRKRIFAYGGAAGLVRIHSFDLREETVGE